jgi:hypothetical protein
MHGVLCKPELHYSPGMHFLTELPVQHPWYFNITTGIACVIIVGVFGFFKPFVSGLLGDNATARAEISKAKGRRVRAWLAFYRLQRRTRRVRLLHELRSNPSALIRYLALPVALTAYVILASAVFFAPILIVKPHSARELIAINHLEHFCVRYILFAAVCALACWVHVYLTIYKSGLDSYFAHLLNKTEVLLTAFQSDYGSPTSGAGIVASLKASAMGSAPPDQQTP